MRKRQQEKLIGKFFARIGGQPCAAMTAREVQWFNANYPRRIVTALERYMASISEGFEEWAATFKSLIDSTGGGDGNTR